MRPRVKRRRRGPDFRRCFRLALRPALQPEQDRPVDFVVHGGDLLYRSRVPVGLVEDAIAPLHEVADCGVDVLLVPGNHERSRIPYGLLVRHPKLHVFDHPRTFAFSCRGCRIAFSGFPFQSRVDRPALQHALTSARPFDVKADVRVVCMHQAIEGARVGVQDFVFRPGPEVVRGSDLPGWAALVASGHIHRGQRLDHDLRRARLPAPVFYPGSVERTSFVERNEVKGSWLIDLQPDPPGRVLQARYLPLPARPMFDFDLRGRPVASLENAVRTHLRGVQRDAVVRIRLAPESVAVPNLERRIRSTVPATMSLVFQISSGIGRMAS